MVIYSPQRSPSRGSPVRRFYALRPAPFRGVDVDCGSFIREDLKDCPVLMSRHELDPIGGRTGSRREDAVGHAGEETYMAIEHRAEAVKERITVEPRADRCGGGSVAREACDGQGRSSRKPHKRTPHEVFHEQHGGNDLSHRMVDGGHGATDWPRWFEFRDRHLQPGKPSATRPLLEARPGCGRDR